MYPDGSENPVLRGQAPRLASELPTRPFIPWNLLQRASAGSFGYSYW